MEQVKVPMKNKLAFGVGDLFGGGAFFIIGALFLVFLTDVVKLDPILAGLVIMVGKVWDAVSDPVMGYITDHTKSKHGRRRFFFLIGILPIMISFSLLWTAVEFQSDVTSFIYYLVVYLLFNTVFTMVMIPYNSMPAQMTSDYKERSKLVGVRMAFSQFGALLGAVLPLTIINSFEDKSLGYIVMGCFFGVVFGSVFIIVFKGTYENPVKIEEVKKEALYKVIIRLMKEFATTFRNKSLRIHVTMYLCAYVAMDIFNAVLIYYLRDYLHRETFYQVLLGVVIIAELIALYFVSESCSKNGNAKTYRRHTAIWIIGIVLLGVLPAGVPVYGLIIVGIITGVGLSGGVMIPYNMLAFVTDADEMITKKRREGTYAGMMTFVRKIAQALALFLVGVCLKVFGYEADTELSSATVNGIRALFVFAPTILIILGFMSSFGFKISPKNHKVMMAEIDRLKQGGDKAIVDEETKEVCEVITGIKYESLWED